MTKMLQLPDRLEAAGVNVRVLDGWQEPHYNGKYKYRNPDGEPAGHMHHHTAGNKYVPNRDKANGYAGLSYLGSERLYQERYQGAGYVPIYTVANAYPAPISSGAGAFSVLEKVRNQIEVVGRQGPDTPDWYGNTHYWNTEWVLDGVGSWVDAEVWEMMLTVCEVQNDLMGWTPNNHICHAHHTRRKIDLWNGEYSNTNRDGFDKTIEALREQMGADRPPTPQPPKEEDVLKLGDTGDSVKKWQNYLNRWNKEYEVGHVALIEDGDYGPATADRQRAFQSWSKIDQTGVVGSIDTGTMGMLIKVRRT